MRLFYKENELIADIETDSDGRCARPLISDPHEGDYRLLFSVGEYFRSLGIESPFLESVPIDFKVLPKQSYHIPLLCTPFSYSTYRGS